MIVNRVFALVAGMTLVLAGCREPKIETYRVPKDPAPKTAEAPPTTPAAPAPAGGTMASTPVATASGPGLTWTAPAHWKQKAGSAMRKGSYSVGAEGAEADLSITAFPGDVGGDLANLNRWRGQIQLPPIGEAEFSKATQHQDHNGLHMTVVDIVGTGATPLRILGAMIPFEGSTWFVKLLGPDATVAKEKEAFQQFLGTIKPASGTAK